MSEVCAGASAALAFILQDEAGPTVEQAWREWLDGENKIVVPPLFYAEVTSVVRERTHRGELTIAEAESGVLVGTGLHVTVYQDTTQLQLRALRFASRFGWPKAYEAQHLAVADLIGCDLWTVDRRLYNRVTRDLPWVRFMGATA